jgi:hypothetical protein
MSVLTKDLADIAENRDHTVFGGGAHRIGQVAHFGKHGVKHGIQQAFLLWEVPIQRSGVNAEFFAQSADRQIRDVVGFHKLQCYSDEIVPSESVFVFCHSKNLSEYAESFELVHEPV